MLSIVIPAYNEEQMIEKTSSVVSSIMEENGIPYEIVFVNDGSKDKTWEKIEQASKDNSHVRGACFSRNFGKEAAVFAGLSEAKGDCAAVMDCDLQHPPVKIVEMYRLWEQGYEVVEGVKTSRGKESAFHSFAAKMFYSLISNATGVDMQNASDFKLLDRKAILVLLNMKEKNAFFRALSSWIGFKTASVYFEVQEREAGVSKWSTKALIKYACSNITSFTTVPMQMVTILGVVMFILTVLQGIECIATYLSGNAENGMTTVILLLLFIGSITMLSLGIIGYYIARVYEEVQGRPRFIISERAGSSENNKV